MSDCMQFLFGRSPGPCLCCTPLCVTALLYIISFIITQTTLMPELDRGCASANEVTRKTGKSIYISYQNTHARLPRGNFSEIEGDHCFLAPPTVAKKIYNTKGMPIPSFLFFPLQKEQKKHRRSCPSPLLVFCCKKQQNDRKHCHKSPLIFRLVSVRRSVV